MDVLNERRQSFARKSMDWTPKPIHQFFFEMADRYQNNDYIITERKTWSYQEIQDAIRKLALNLYEQGIQKGDHVALILPNFAEFVIAKLASTTIGAVTVPVNFRLKHEELKYLINQSKSSYLIVIDEWNSFHFIEALRELSPEVFEGKPSAVFPHLKKLIVFSPEGKKYTGTLDLHELIASSNKQEALTVTTALQQERNIDVHDLTEIMYTSGTTSMPKGVIVTHDMLWRSAYGSCLNRGYQEGRRIFVPLPFYHTFGFVEGVLASMYTGGSIIPQLEFNGDQAAYLIEKFKADDIVCVPTIALKLVEAQRKNPRDFSSLSAMYCAGAEVSVTLWQELKDELQINELITGFGMTELAAGVLQTDPNDDLSFLTNYVGKTIPGGHFGLNELNGNNIAFKIRDPETGEIFNANREGELISTGPLVTKGYYDKPKETAEAFTEDGWFRTGDIGFIHDNGYISLTGRLKEIYRMGAENVSPKEIEDVITSHSSVNQAYVIGVPDPVMGEVGMAWIVLEPDAALTKEEIMDYLTSRLARFKIPKYIKFVEHSELPMNQTGKIQKFRLKERYESEKIKVESLI
ncbi:fatty-acyl-CoA synthase [Neobacillus niacini]|uniref:class I adenylate-forming enzyme family protein n=1 Tax=Neobacillus niacini TaxID=86668 RepID=UPI0028614F82|nr:class I adenylate-forming enzyme family protein [Neobacillus niacini]MDR7080129.1 fatty-acyl-CoA synthase [Neobacillus niacini]